MDRKNLNSITKIDKRMVNKKFSIRMDKNVKSRNAKMESGIINKKIERKSREKRKRKI